MDKSNLQKKIAELDEMVKALLGPKSTQQQSHQASSSKVYLHVNAFHKISCSLCAKGLFVKQNFSRTGNVDFAKRLEQSEKLLSRVNGELAQYYKSTRDRTSGHGL